MAQTASWLLIEHGLLPSAFMELSYQERLLIRYMIEAKAEQQKEEERG